MGFAMFFSSCAFTYSKVRFLLSGRVLRPRVEIVLQFAEPLQHVINALVIIYGPTPEWSANKK
jgi:hypothetical protein